LRIRLTPLIDFRSKIPASQIAEVLGATALILWRIWEIPLTGLWRDWITLLAVYWLFSIFAGEKRSATPVTLTLMAGLMILYGWGQYPYLLRLLGLSS
jgi:hypothetical protein